MKVLAALGLSFAICLPIALKSAFASSVIIKRNGLMILLLVCHYVVK